MRQFTTFDGLFNFSRNSGGYVFNGARYVHKNAGEPRFAYNTDGSFRGLMKEASQTNLFTWSHDFSKWQTEQTTVQTNTGVNPLGIADMCLLSEGNANGTHQLIAPSKTINGGETGIVSVFAKQGPGSRYLCFNGWGMGAAKEMINFDLMNGDVSMPGSSTIAKDAGMIDYGGGVYFCWAECVRGTGTGDFEFRLVQNHNQHDGSSSSYQGDGSSGVYLWGAQIVQGSFYTSPIVTQGSQVTRAEDVIKTDNADWFSNLAGSLFLEAEYPVPTDSLNYKYVGLFGESSFFGMNYDDNVANINVGVHGGTASVVSYNLNSDQFKAMATWDGTNVSLYVNGNDAGTYSGGYTSISNQPLKIGGRNPKLYVKKAYFSPYTLSDSDAIAATS